MDTKKLAQVIDTEILDLHYREVSLLAESDMLVRKAKYDDRAYVELEAVKAERVQMTHRRYALENVYGAYGWSRAYIVPGGHVHRDYHCHTLFVDTQRFLVPEVSGMTEDEIVAKAGERACTVCYPSAPSEYLKRKTELFTRDEKEKEEARRAREAKRAAKEAAKIVVEIEQIGSRTKRLYTHTETFGTLRSAQNAILSKLWWAHQAASYQNNGLALEYYNECKPIAEAMARHPQEKRTAEEIMKECDTKAEAKFKKDMR